MPNDRVEQFGSAQVSGLPSDLDAGSRRNDMEARFLWIRHPFTVFGRHRAQQGKWAGPPLDIMIHIVDRVHPSDLKALHRVSRSWNHAVRAGARVLSPHTFCPGGIQANFPALRVLHLHGMSFDMESAASLGQISRLECLHLQACEFIPGASFVSLKGLQGLQVLEVSDMMGPTSAEMDMAIRDLTSLRRLVARKTCGGMKLPHLREVTRLTNLRELMLADMYFNHMLPGHTSLAYLTNLRALTLYRVGVTNGLLRAASGLTSLEVLDIRDSFGVTDSGLPYLAPLTGLRHLDLCCISQRRDEDLTDNAINVLSACSQLTRLNLSGHAALSSRGLAFVTRLTALQCVDLSGIPLWMGGADFLGHLTGLTRLDLNRTMLCPPQLRVLTNFPLLRDLGLASSMLDDDSISLITPLTDLTSLDIRFCPVHNNGVVTLLKALPALEALLVEGCPLSVLGVLTILRSRKQLRFWALELNGIPPWRNKLEMIIMYYSAPHVRHLRLLVQPEDTLFLTLTVIVILGVAVALYFGILAAFLLGAVVLPLLAVVVAFAICVMCVMGANYMWVRVKEVAPRVLSWIRCSCAAVRPDAVESLHMPPV